MHRPDQSKNDFEKCLELIASLRGTPTEGDDVRVEGGSTTTASGAHGHTETDGGGASSVELGDFALPVERVSELYVFGGLDGRLDHTVANLGIIHKHLMTFRGGVVLISEHSVATLLGAGTHEVHA
jgi:thiamine pyrophosphokinase